MIRNNTFSRALTWAALGSALTATAHAQLLGGGGGGAPGNTHAPAETFALPTPGSESTGTFSRLCTGDFNGDFSPDFAIVQGNRVLISGSPGGTRWWLATGILANDVAARQDESPGEKARFITVWDDGIHEHSVTAAGGISSTQLDSSSAWDGARFVESGQTLVGAFLEDRLVGIKSGGQTVEVLSSSGAGTWTTATLNLSEALGADAVDLKLVDLDGNQELEVAIVTPIGLKIYELSTGTLLDSHAFSGYVTTSLSAGRMSNGSEYLAWTARKNNKDRVLTIDQSGISSYALLGNIQIVGATTVEWVEEGESDLALSLQNLDQMWVITNTGASRPVLSLNDYTVITLGETAAANTTRPAAADVDLDGDMDLFLPMQSSENVVISRNATADQESQEADILYYEDFGDMKAATPTECGSQPNAYHTLNIMLGRPPGPASAATHVGYAVWKQASDPQHVGQPANWDTDPEAVVPQQYQPFQVGVTELDLSIDMPEPDSSGCALLGILSEHIYYVELQLVVMDASGVVTAFPSKLLGTQTGGLDPTNGDYLDLIGFGPTYQIVYDPDLDPSNVGSADEVTELPNLTPGIVLIK